MAAFSNGTEWECWSANWCERCVYEETCPLVELALFTDETPAEWRFQEHNLGRKYVCTKFQPYPPGQAR